MTVDTFTLVVQLVLLTAIILTPWFYRTRVKIFKTANPSRRYDALSF
jgi:hypothetical protein